MKIEKQTKQGLWAILCCICMGLIFCPGAQAADEVISMSKGGMQSIETDFAVKGISIADKAIIRVEREASQKIRVVGLAQGTTSFQVTGSGDHSAQYDVNVVPEISVVLSSVRRRLEDIPGVEATMDAASGKVLIEGDAYSLDQWSRLERVVGMYSPQVMNLAEFNLTPEAKQRLMTAFEALGIKVVEKPGNKSAAPGVISMQISRNCLVLRGTVLNQGDLAKIQGVLAAHQWMLAEPGTDPGKEGKVMAVVDVKLDSTSIELGMAIITMSESDFQARTGNLLERGLMFVSDTSAAVQGKFGSGIDNSSSSYGNYTISTELNGALRLMSGDGKRNTEKIGHMRLQSNAAEAQEYLDGGTIKTKVSGETSGDVIDIPYGLEIKAKGFLSDSATAQLMLDGSATVPLPLGNGDYNIVGQDFKNTPVSCPLGQTVVIAGSKQTMETLGQKGIPFLRKIPVINWFTSDKESGSEEVRVLVLISSHLAGGGTSSQPMSEQTLGLKDRM